MWHHTLRPASCLLLVSKLKACRLLLSWPWLAASSVRGSGFCGISCLSSLIGAGVGLASRSTLLSTPIGNALAHNRKPSSVRTGDLDGQPNPLLPAARMACGAVHTWRSSDASPVKGAGNSSPFTSGLGVGGLVPGSASRHLGLVLGPAVEAGAGQPGSHDEQGPCRHRRKTREQHSRAGASLRWVGC